jgi:hypothetical protein
MTRNIVTLSLVLFKLYESTKSKRLLVLAVGRPFDHGELLLNYKRE